MKYLSVFLIIVVFGVGGFFLWQKRIIQKTESNDVHIHAGFVVYKDGVKEGFSGLTYMSFKPCSENEEYEEELTPEEEQLEKAHLHDRVGDVVHIHREDVLWQDLFTNINYSLTDLSVKGYLNGQEAENILNRKITAYDSAVFFVSEGIELDLVNIDELLKGVVTKEHIQQIEQNGETC